MHHIIIDILGTKNKGILPPKPAISSFFQTIAGGRGRLTKAVGSGSLKFLFLVTEVMVEDEREAFTRVLKKHKNALKSSQEEGLVKTFLREFVKSAGKEAGKTSIRLGAAVLTNGLSEIPALVDALFGENAGAAVT